MTRPAVAATEADALCFWLGDAAHWGFVRVYGGQGWHVRDARGQRLADLPDVLMVLPRPDGSALVAVLEIKIGRDALRPGQRDALDRFARAGAVALVVRYNRPPGEGEVDQDEAVRLIEEELGSDG